MDIYLAFVFLMFGLIVGSAINSLVWRLGEDISLSGRSICPACRHTIAWYDNIPIFSFLLLRGRCRSCRARIPWHYLAVEGVAGLIFLAVFLYQYHIYGPFLFPTGEFWLHSAISSLIAATLLFSFVFDAKYYLISNAVIVPAALLVAALHLIAGVSWLSLAQTFIISLLFFGAQFLLTKRKGIGEGDIWLGAALALMYPNIGQWLVLVALSYFLGAAVGLSLMALGKKGRKDRLPLGVFLAIGGLISLFFGEQIVSWYLSLLVL